MQIDKSAILITGALGGLGTALVEMSRNLSGLDHIIATDVREEIEGTYKDDLKVIGFTMDVSSENAIIKVRNQLHEMGIFVKYLINSAGISIFYPVSESTEELLDKILKVNTYGPILTVSVFLEDLIKNRGRVVQISSDSVRLPTLFQPYPNSKIALEAFSTSMRQELGLLGVDLVIIRPGAINTNLVAEMKSISNPITNSKYEKYFQTFMKLAQADVGKMVEPAKVAELVKKALVAKKPRKIYSINKNAKISLLVKFPPRWRDLLISKAIRKRI
jgi:short-subunit dehydrogenase